MTQLLSEKSIGNIIDEDFIQVTKTDDVYDILHDGLFLNLSPKFTDDKQSS